jgi:hypothetical protein
MSRVWSLLPRVVVLASLAAGCGTQSTTPEATCVPAQTTPCQCANGAAGTQTCAPSGMALSACSCTVDGSADSTAGCAAAGGQCVIGNFICAVVGPEGTCGSGPSGAYCCLSEMADCGQPDATSYVCPTTDAGLACRVSALTAPSGAPNSQALATALGKSDASYSLGCIATFPACNKGRPPSCTCSLQQVPTWSCAY